MSNINNNNIVDQVFSINRSDPFASNVLNNDPNQLDLLNFENQENKNDLNFLDGENNQEENPENNQPEEDVPEEEETPEKEEEIPEIVVPKIDEQEKYILQQQIIKSTRNQKEIETEGDLEEIAETGDEGIENAKVKYNKIF
jgi:hypothetical protein